MLGFSAVSEAPISQASISGDARGVITGVTASSANTALVANGIAFHVIEDPTMAATVASVTLDAQATGTFGSVSATHSINDVSNVGIASFTPPAATAVMTANSLDFSGIASKTIASVVATIPECFPAFDAEGTATISTSAIGNTSVAATTVDFTASIALSGATAATSTNDVTQIAEVNLSVYNTVISGVADTSGGTINAAANANASTVLASVSASTFVTEAQATSSAASVIASVTANLTAPTGVVYQYDATEYSKQRTVFLIGYNENNTVHVKVKNNTVYINEIPSNNTVVITK